MPKGIDTDKEPAGAEKRSECIYCGRRWLKSYADECPSCVKAKPAAAEIEEDCRCPKCGHKGTEDDFDVGAADAGTCFCNACGAEVLLVDIDVAPADAEMAEARGMEKTKNWDQVKRGWALTDIGHTQIYADLADAVTTIDRQAEQLKAKEEEIDAKARTIYHLAMTEEECEKICSVTHQMQVIIDRQAGQIKEVRRVAFRWQEIAGDRADCLNDILDHISEGQVGGKVLDMTIEQLHAKIQRGLKGSD